MNFPFASRQGVAAIDDVEPATKATAANPKISLRILRLPYLERFNWAHFDPGSKDTRVILSWYSGGTRSTSPSQLLESAAALAKSLSVSLHKNALQI